MSRMFFSSSMIRILNFMGAPFLVLNPGAG